ncbi:hypothetical protein, conserved in T. vivax [Trypanosoma vivax Y486]|uniref:Proteophosphoglycan ppg4 n=1 Tax=Trypanosoma vivax (strain Y486) TaxID=1055687 RepID=F9WMN7_TRYVY|nr:hypothetical protein, conserved in T. vivax [Trypanosoma vivax Y486]|eukprot:CCD18796.1 hypothetical protein, conserved in T. vivax [Trypanosoma vivax Y486]
MACSALSTVIPSVRFLPLSNEASPPFKAVILTKVPRCTVFRLPSACPVAFRSSPPLPAWPLAAMARRLQPAPPAEAVTAAPSLFASGRNCAAPLSSFYASSTLIAAKGSVSIHLSSAMSAHARASFVLALLSLLMVPVDISFCPSMQLNDCPACTPLPSAASAVTDRLSEPLPTVSALAAFAVSCALLLSSLSALPAPFPCSASTAATTDVFLPSSGAAKLAANEAISFTAPAVAARLSASCAKLVAYLPANLKAPAYLHRPFPSAVCSPFGAAASQAAAASANNYAAIQQSFPILYSFAPCANRLPKKVQCCGFSAVPCLAREQNSIPPPPQAPRHVSKAESRLRAALGRPPRHSAALRPVPHRCSSLPVLSLASSLPVPSLRAGRDVVCPAPRKPQRPIARRTARDFRCRIAVGSRLCGRLSRRTPAHACARRRFLATAPLHTRLSRVALQTRRRSGFV